jgi:hypothetical protein
MSNRALRWARQSRGLTPTQKLVLFVLADAAADADCTCWNAAASIAMETGLSDRAVRTALHDLIEAGAISGTMRSGVRPLWTLAVEETGTTFLPKRKGVPIQKRNHVPSNRKQVPSKPETRSVKPEPSSDEPSRTLIEPSGTLILSAPARDPRPDHFEAWWQHYPRKVGKDAARRAYAAALKRGARDAELASGLMRQRWPQDPQFIPHAATWLNGGRWQDDPGAAAPRPNPPARPVTALRQWAALLDPAPLSDLDGHAEEVFP